MLTKPRFEDCIKSFENDVRWNFHDKNDGDTVIITKIKVTVQND